MTLSPFAHVNSNGSAFVAARMEAAFAHRTWSVGAAANRGRFHAFLVVRGTARFHPENAPAAAMTGPFMLWLPRTANGEFRLMAGGDGFTFSLAEDVVWRTIGDSPAAPHLRPLFERILVAPAERIAPCLTELRVSFEALVRESREQQPGAAAISSAHLMVLLLHLWRAADLGNAAGLRGTASSTAQRFRQLVELHYRENLGIDDYARRLGVTRAHLHEACLRATKRTPLALIHDRLVAEARSRLEQTDLPVEQIGYSLGFRDPSYFNRFFKKQTGRTPAAFRQHAISARPPIELAASFAAWP